MSTITLVTGGNRGIGREVCRQLAGRGHTVILTARSAGAAEAAPLRPRLGHLGRNTHWFAPGRSGWLTPLFSAGPGR